MDIGMMIMKGAPVAAAIVERTAVQIEKLKAQGKTPCLATLRIGENESDISYEKSIIKRFGAAGAEVKVNVLPTDVSQAKLESALLCLNADKSINGILTFRPFPRGLSEERIKTLIDPGKDVDGMSPANLAGVFSGDPDCFAPCTARAVVEVLDYYGIDIVGKRAVVVGRSMVIGRPVAMLLLSRNATVTICHTKTRDIEAVCREADILVACAGVAHMINRSFVKTGQVIVDVGINVTENGITGDVDTKDVETVAAAITPVPGGVGGVTAAVLLEHTVKSALAKI
jgi:methylenetetrahydrofolate dehydrogenase (NADP+)/methenyltetrahydrofolate cyclohydrolase